MYMYFHSELCSAKVDKGIYFLYWKFIAFRLCIVKIEHNCYGIFIYEKPHILKSYNNELFVTSYKYMR